MSRMSELDLCVGELRNAAQALGAAAESLAALFRPAGSSRKALLRHGACHYAGRRCVRCWRTSPGAGHTDAVRRAAS
jgi:hypothetical protein